MKISVEKLVANRANAQKSSGPQTRAGKLRSARNALKHGLGAQSPKSLQNPSLLDHFPEFKSYQQELTALGYSDAQSQEMVEAILTARQVTEAKQSAYTDRLNEERLANMTIQGLTSLLREFGDPAATVTSMSGLVWRRCCSSRCKKIMIFRAYCLRSLRHTVS